jgi:uncharacterized protein DUF6370
MKQQMFKLGLAVALMLAFVATTARAADEVTVNGTIVCAKCKLKKADASKCQDVLVATDAQGATTEYYIAKNDTSEKAGHACTTETKASVTGTVSEKDGKKWITASKIEKS